jgi:hypothetical protein
MQTEKVLLKESLILPKYLLDMREMSEVDWIQKYGSGTLRDSVEYGTAYKTLYRHERICWEYGSGFECIPTTRVLPNIIIAEGDCPQYREALYYFKKIKARRLFQEDYYEFKYINITESDDSVRQGAGIILRATTTSWIPDGHMVLAIVAEYDTKTKQWKDAVNPC